jgi:hypothetical protein
MAVGLEMGAQHGLQLVHLVVIPKFAPASQPGEDALTARFPWAKVASCPAPQCHLRLPVGFLGLRLPD